MARFRRLNDLNDPPPYIDQRWNLFLPPAPTGVTATAGNAQATVSWTAPSVVSATPITDYVVQFRPVGGSWQTFSDGLSTSTSATVTGLTNGTAYEFSVAGVNAVGVGAYSAASSAVTPQAGDPLFSQVALLLHMDGTGSTFLDSSKYASAVTAYGNATQSATQSKWGGKSLYLDGASRLSIPSDNAFNFGGSNGAFCVEFWMYMTAYASNYTTIITRRGPSNWQWQLGFPNTGRYLNFSTFSGASFTGQDSAEVPLNTWQHVALAYDGTTYRLYRDGALVASSTASSGFEDTGSDITIGAVPGGGENFTGYIDDLRITKGNARYTGSSITVPTAAFPEAVAGTDPWIDNVSLLLHADGSGSTFVDSSPTPKTITAGGGATQSATHSKWGGKSAYFSGSGDFLSFADLELGTGDFTIEMFFKTNSSVQYAQLIGNEVSSGFSGFSLLINNDSSTGGQIALYRGSLIVQSASGDWSDDAWHHIAVVRSGSTVTLYIDGTSYGSGTTSASFNGGNYYVAYNNEFGPRNVVGYIDDLRITKAARYTGSTITVPTAAFPDA